MKEKLIEILQTSGKTTTATDLTLPALPVNGTEA